MKVSFEGGRNIAVKVPPHQFDETVRFYHETLALERLPTAVPGSVAFRFGPCTLWIDRSQAMSQAEVWLEVITRDTGQAADALDAAGVVRCDAIEPLPQDLDGFRIASPCGVVHLVDEAASSH